MATQILLEKQFPPEYQALIGYLVNNQWEAANQITETLQDLQIVDELWMRFSDGRFGFSVQSQIWQEMGGYVVRSPKDYGAGWETGDSDVEQEKCNAFFARVGWWGAPTFSLSAPYGHLPWGNGRSLRSLTLRFSEFLNKKDARSLAN